LKKVLLLALLIAGIKVAAFAQVGGSPKLSIGADFGLPTGTVSEVYNAVIGASAKLELSTVTPGLKFMFTAGYSDFEVKSIYKSVFTSASYGQVEAGARYYFIPMIYAEGDFGVSFNLNKNYTEQKVGLAYDPTIGVNLPLSAKSALDVGIRYDGRVESGGTISQVALRVAYKFDL